MQLAGRALIFAVFAPPLLALLGVGAAFFPADEDGRAPAWLTRAREGVFRALWRSYDLVWKRRFGDGEVDVCDEEREEGSVKER